MRWSGRVQLMARAHAVPISRPVRPPDRGTCPGPRLSLALPLGDAEPLAAVAVGVLQVQPADFQLHAQILRVICAVGGGALRQHAGGETQGDAHRVFDLGEAGVTGRGWMRAKTSMGFSPACTRRMTSRLAASYCDRRP